MSIRDQTRKRILLLIPLALLGIDYLHTPVLLKGCSNHHSFTPADLVQSRSVLLGKLAGSTFRVSTDDIDSDVPLFPYAGTGRTGLVVSADLTQQGTITLALASAAMDRLRRAQPKAATELSNLLLTNQVPSGGVQVKQLQLGAQKNQFPADYLYIVSLDYNAAIDGKDGKKAKLREGLSNVLQKAAENNIDDLVLPCIGVLPGEPKALQFEQFFPIVFESKNPSSRPKNIYLSLYGLWPESTRTTAVQEIQQAWKDKCDNSSQESVLVHENPRILFLTTTLCLLASSFLVPLTVKNFLIVACSYAGSGFGTLSFIDFFAGSYSSQVRLILHVAVLIVLAGLFPFLANWNPKDIFDPHER